MSEEAERAHGRDAERDRTLPHATGTNVPVWDPHGALTLPRLEGTVETDLCVIGLGGSGLTAVLRARELGLATVGVDAGPVAGGAAGRNGGLLLAGTTLPYHRAVQALGRERAVRLYLRTVREIAAVVDEAPGAGDRSGSLRIAADAIELDDCEAQRRAMREDGLPVEPYGGPEGRGLLFPEDGVVDPLMRCRAMARAALREGAVLFGRSPVVTVDAPHDKSERVVRTRHGRVRCRHVIVAIDGGLERLLPELANTVRTVRLQMLATAPTDHPPLPRPVYYRYGFEYWRRTPDGRIALGGFRDAGGASEATDDPTPGGVVQERLTRFLRERLCVHAAITHRWAASVGFGPGTLPFVGEVRRGVWAAGGYDGTGNLIGAIAGRALAERVAGRDPDELRWFRGS
ncbi:MAG: FAD-binding oxidoreductase [Trueperaceae bacterium]